MNKIQTDPSQIRMIYRWRSPWHRLLMRLRWLGRRIGLEKKIQCVQEGHVSSEPLGDESFVVLCKFKNGALYLDTFIKHYMGLGASRIVLLDNASTDESREIIGCYPQVCLLHTTTAYYPYMMATRHYLQKKYAKNAWSLSVDIDELFDFPGSEEVSMKALLGYLNQGGYNAMHAYMLDRFGTKPIGKAGSQVGDDLTTKYPFYDLADIRRIPLIHADVGPKGSNVNSDIQHCLGGVRMRVLGTNPFLSKFPLVRNGCGQVSGVHRIYNAKIADISGVLNHFRFLDDLGDVAKNFIQNSNPRYKMVLDAEEAGEELTPYREGVNLWRGPDALVDEGFLAVSEAYRSWVKSSGEEGL